ncbi:MAG: hypothetical protein ACXWZU_10260 [Actinomycetota bacterium]
MRPLRPSTPVGMQPLDPRAKWRAILLSTLLLVPGYFALVVGLVSVATEGDGPPPGPFIAFGLSLVPFVFIALAMLSQHPYASGAVVKAMILTLVIGIPVAGLTGDPATGMVAGIGAGGVVALRAEPEHRYRARALAVAVATIAIFVLVRVVPAVGLLLAACLPFTSIGVADHLVESRGADHEAS